MTAFLRLFGGCCLVLTMLGATSSAADTKPSRPNIIFILADDYGIPGVGCYGGNHKTPHLDALAKGGTRFENCFAEPLCGPTRATLMTGRYVFRTGMLTNGHGRLVSPDREVCIARVLKQAGYATAVAGKWRQLQYFQTKEDAQRWGFDEFLTWGGGTADMEANAAQNASQKAKKKQAGKNDSIEKGERYWEPAYNHNGQPLTNVEGKYGPDLLHNFVVDFIERHRAGPFFVYYPTPLIHGPILRTPDSQPGASRQQHYEDNIAYLDKLVGKLVAELDRLKLRENTLIVFTGDNGSVPYETVHGRKVDGHKSDLLEGGSRVPLIVNWPGVTPAGAVRKDLIDFSDLFPTFAELAGAKLPDNVTIDGRSFAAAIKGEKGSPREWVYIQLGEKKKYVRDAGWKLNNDGEFFDMRNAPFEQIAVPNPTGEAKAAREKLQAVLEALIAEDKTTDVPTQKKKKTKA